MGSALKFISGLAVALGAAVCFVAAVVIDRQPSVGSAPIPEAADVRSTVEFAKAIETLIAVNRPVDIHAPARWFEGVHRLVGHAKDNLAMDARFGRSDVLFRVSKRFAPHAWLNLSFRLAESSQKGPPDLVLYAGGWRAPDVLTNLALKAALPLLDGDGKVAVGLADLIPRFAVRGNEIDMNARIPKQLIGGLQAALGSGGGTPVDMAQARSIYGDLLGYVLLNPSADYPQVVAHAIQGVSDREGLRSALVALTMLVDGPRVRRLAGERTATPPCQPAPQVLLIHGRSDLPKHWTLSAALALFMDSRPARAIGLWKELDDSLPGGDGVAKGTGFSFVDLAADTGGVAVGKAARDGTEISSTLAALRTGQDDVILPRAVLQFPEGVTIEDYRHRFGGLEQPQMLRAEAQIKAALRRSVLYRSILPNAL